ncbi:unnamed protein product [Oikopleura dioica]|uniref:Uncharacterized protein n=1 Tax=Oikopleura dioica TaxID=34765 RepID=E4WZE8_OIKDI|nr:unnamed protein product [Oikopleura dioica]CBY36323.1 unnamed protein product [Oikopleura dioica]
MSSKRSSMPKFELSDKIEELDELLLKTQIENYQKTAIIVGKQIQLLKTENAEIEEKIKKREQELAPCFIEKWLESIPKKVETESSSDDSSRRCELCKQKMPKKKEFGSKSNAIVEKRKSFF